MVYSFQSFNRGSKFLDIECTVENNKDEEVFLQLPAWRPGRYELANFAKNIQKLEVRTLNNKRLDFEKVTKDKWRIKTGKIKKFKITYNYYANTLDAGSTWVDDHQIYINPINCCLYVEGRQHESVRVILENTQKNDIATSLKKKENYFFAESFDELVDSPIIISERLQHGSYKVKGVKFNVWFHGECKPPWKKILKDFKRFTQEQLNVFNEFPFTEYHFLYQILPFKAYHGVEHQKSTVICLGPGYSVFDDENYEEFLGVSSHELFHAWNVKSIRPADMLPYDYTKENYTRMGYLTEGVTTYYGDLMLKRSGVFTKDQFIKQINKTLDRHFYNYGTLNKSVADSSFDTWLDGYERGIPNRKGSIYTEGCLMACILDLTIRGKSQGEKSLDDVMNTFFNKRAKLNKGITEDFFKLSIEKALGSSLDLLWKNYFYGKEQYYSVLKEVLQPFGIGLKKEENQDKLAAKYGFYSSLGSSKAYLIAPDSPAEKAGITIGDEIIAINGITIKSDSAKHWAEYFGGKLEVTIKKDGRTKNMNLFPSSQSFFPKVRLILPSSKQNKLLKNWLGA
ncbi:MAG: peptidase M61 [Flavobacteriales bacterium]|mgnify:CR=1 FL=1|nr:peptidase M61 [Flavobacteriales bacterium]|tara:strand:- start:31512 stop:33212 length:1701 start_codon:yes stop_codon:yes gene_type:complete